MELVCLDLEGVLIPEIWINVAERTGIEELRATTRDIPDYNVLMKQRLGLLDVHGLGLLEIQAVIDTLEPMAGAIEFVSWLRQRYQLIILSDTFYEFAAPLMKKLGSPTLFCHSLEVDGKGRVVNYHLRQPDQKRRAVEAFQALNFQVYAAGDSYNDTSMLAAANAGFLFCPPENVIQEFPQFPVTRDYTELQAAFAEARSLSGLGARSEEKPY